MKRFILFLFIAFVVSGCDLLREIITEHGIFMRNDTNDHLLVWGTYDQNNGTRLPNERPMCEPVGPTEDISRASSIMLLLLLIASISGIAISSRKEE